MSLFQDAWVMESIQLWLYTVALRRKKHLSHSSEWFVSNISHTFLADSIILVKYCVTLDIRNTGQNFDCVM